MGTPLLCCLLGKFKADEADFYDISRPGRNGFAGGLIIDVGAIHTADVAHVPGTMAILDIGVGT